MARIFTSIHDPAVIDLLSNGAVGIIPTDTVYGLVCQASKPESVARLYGLKHREHKPGTLIASNIGQLVELGIPRRYLKAVERFWPGSISVETPHHVDYLTQQTGRQAIRIPPDDALRQLMDVVGPLQTTSANAPDEPTATTIKEAQTYFGDDVDFYVDGGEIKDHKPSTIIRVIDDAIEVIREGAVKIDENGRIN